MLKYSKLWMLHVQRNGNIDFNWKSNETEGQTETNRIRKRREQPDAVCCVVSIA